MKKIMFNDKYSLTKAVLEGRKTQTRRIIHIDPAIRIDGYKTMPDGSVACAHLFEKENIWMIDVNYKASYKVGEEVAVAQSYNTIIQEIFDKGGEYKGNCDIFMSKGLENKMFVKADLMPHRIKITKIRVERLQDISDEDCLKEGIVERYITAGVVGYFLDTRLYSKPVFRTPREAFAYLIDKVSGKGTWDSNPYVFVYDFELVK